MLRMIHILEDGTGCETQAGQSSHTDQQGHFKDILMSLKDVLAGEPFL